jgi:hypothetical protein
MNNSNSPVKIIILLLVVLVGGYWFYSKSDNLSEDGAVISEVADKVLVPQGVTPRTVTLTTLEQLRGQSFFKQAALGDVIVMYPDSVILYRPQIDKIITIGTLDPTVSAQLFNADPSLTANGPLPTTVPATGAVVDPAATPGTTASDPAAVTVTPVSGPVAIEIRNGTATSGLAKKLSAKLTVDKNVTVPTTGNAQNTSYVATTIVNLTGADLPASVTGVIQGATIVTELPVGEKAIDSAAKVLVIIGADIASKVPGL